MKRSWAVWGLGLVVGGGLGVVVVVLLIGRMIGGIS